MKKMCIMMCFVMWFSVLAGSAFGLIISSGEGFESYDLETWTDDPYAADGTENRSSQITIPYCSVQTPGAITSDAFSGNRALLSELNLPAVTSTINQHMMKLNVDDSRGASTDDWTGATSLDWMYKITGVTGDLKVGLIVDASGGRTTYYDYQPYIADGEWHLMSIDFTTEEMVDPGNVHTITWKTRSTVTDDAGTIIFDDLQVVPEPATLTLLALGSSMMLRRRK